jgi:hypothetical protein
MMFLVIAMLVALVLAGLVAVYVAFPHRGEDVPHVPWVGHALRRGVDNAPTLDNTADPDDVEPGHETTSLASELTSLGRGRPEGRRRP